METYIVRKEDDKLFLFKKQDKIGEISPDATWVKEGDEFNEKEWREVWDSSTGWRFSDDEFFNPKYCYRKLDWVQVKGPCGHFH